MPAFLESKLKQEYPGEPDVPYKIMNAMGAMKGNKITPKGEAMDAKHAADTKKKKPSGFAVAKLMGPSRREKTRSDISDERR